MSGEGNRGKVGEKAREEDEAGEGKKKRVKPENAKRVG